MRETIQYIRHILPVLLEGLPLAERPAVPMIDTTLSKQNALPPDLWGLLYDRWQPTPEEGSTILIARNVNLSSMILRMRSLNTSTVKSSPAQRR